MKISKQSRRDAKVLFRTCTIDGLLDDNRVRQAVQLVIDRKPRGYVAILSHFQRLLKLEIARRTANVESAVSLSDSLQAEVRANLNRIYGRGLNIGFAQNPSLIGGIRIQVGSDVFDGSVQARLAALQET